MQTGDQALVKELNKAIILNSIRVHGPTSRARVAELVGLNKTTVSALVSELISEDYVVELGVGKARQAGGRKPHLLGFNGNVGHVVGVELGVTYILTILINLNGEVLASRQVDIHPLQAKDKVLEILVQEIQSIQLQKSWTPHGLMGIGVGVPGLVDRKRENIMFAPNLKWENVPLKAMLAEHFPVPIYLENEANAGAIGEYWFGTGRDSVSNLAYFSVGIGLGVGIVFKGELYRGSFGIAGEYGHATLDINGPVCSCGGKGCLEALASESALLREVSLLDNKESYGYPSGKNLADLDPSEMISITQNVVDAAERRDIVAQDILGHCGRSLGIGILNFIKAFNPEMVVLGGPFPQRAGTWLLDPVTTVVETNTFRLITDNVRIVPSSLGLHARAVGAASLVVQDILRIPRIRAKIPTKTEVKSKAN